MSKCLITAALQLYWVKFTLDRILLYSIKTCVATNPEDAFTKEKKMNTSAKDLCPDDPLMPSFAGDREKFKTEEKSTSKVIDKCQT